METPVVKNETIQKQEIFENQPPQVATQETEETKEHKSFLPYILITIIVVLLVVLVVFIIKRPKPNTEELTKLQETFEASKRELKELQAKNKELKEANGTLNSQIKLLDETNQDLMKHTKNLQTEIDERRKAEAELEKLQNKKPKTFKERKQELFDKSNQYIKKEEDAEETPVVQPTEIHTDAVAPAVKQEPKAAPGVPKVDISEDIDLDDVIN